MPHAVSSFSLFVLLLVALLASQVDADDRGVLALASAEQVDYQTADLAATLRYEDRALGGALTRRLFARGDFALSLRVSPSPFLALPAFFLASSWTKRPVVASFASPGALLSRPSASL